jgi:hypothetical protein
LKYQDLESERQLTKEEKILVIEEKLKSMKDIKTSSVSKQDFKGGDLDIRINDFNKRNSIDLMPQTRRPKALSKAEEFKNKNQA